MLVVKAAVALVLMLGLMPATASAATMTDKGLEVTRAQYGAEWPYAGYEAGRLRCSAGAVTIALGNNVYALNGHAIGQHIHPPVTGLLARDPQWGTYVLGATNKLIKLGLSICGPPFG